MLSLFYPGVRYLRAKHTYVRQEPGGAEQKRHQLSLPSVFHAGEQPEHRGQERSLSTGTRSARLMLVAGEPKAEPFHHRHVNKRSVPCSPIFRLSALRRGRRYLGAAGRQKLRSGCCPSLCRAVPIRFETLLMFTRCGVSSKPCS